MYLRPQRPTTSLTSETGSYAVLLLFPTGPTAPRFSLQLGLSLWTTNSNCILFTISFNPYPNGRVRDGEDHSLGLQMRTLPARMGTTAFLDHRAEDLSQVQEPLLG